MRLPFSFIFLAFQLKFIIRLGGQFYGAVSLGFLYLLSKFGHSLSLLFGGILTVRTGA